MQDTRTLRRFTPKASHVRWGQFRGVPDTRHVNCVLESCRLGTAPRCKYCQLLPYKALALSQEVGLVHHMDLFLAELVSVPKEERPKGLRARLRLLRLASRFKAVVVV